MITIIDYGMGNLGSIQNMLRRVGVSSEITGDPERIKMAKKIILPGVGAFDTAMDKINKNGLRTILDSKAMDERIPILGVCLGMQLLTRSSEEGKLAGLGWIPASTIRFHLMPKLKIPHMGWNIVHPTQSNVLTKGLPDESRFYFVHSYYVHADNRSDCIMQTEYGVMFDAVINNANIFGAQFHPEKSHKFGMKLLSNFAELPC